ncbi:MAG: autotransporter outer membrane beta-barrel domain-containing protein [Desulfobacterales bacterium]|nr:autotransporter outer membrane beta-barrel domain-containing protein [Desulfobacterales bacterium]
MGGRPFILGCLAILLLLLCRPGLSGAVPGKIYTDMNLSNQNSDHVTGMVLWKNFGYPAVYHAGIGITDPASHSPTADFSNTGTLQYTDADTMNNWNFSGIAHENATINVQNSGNITLDLTASIMGVYGNGIDIFGDIVNSGNIDIRAQGGAVGAGTPVPSVILQGLFTNKDRIDNSGNITLHGRGSSATGPAHGRTEAYGIRLWGTLVNNSGDITVRAIGGDVTTTSGDAYGTAVGIYSRGDVHNSGNITVIAQAGKQRNSATDPWVSDDATAYGIQIVGSGTLDSRGLISTQAELMPGLSGGVQSAYQVHVSSGVVSVTGYAAQLTDQANFSNDYHGMIKTGTGGSVNFNNAVLYLSVTQNFTGQSHYEIPMLVENAPISDQFTQVTGLPPEYTVSLVNGNGAALQKIQLAFAPQMSAPLVASQVRDGFNAQGHSMVGDRILHHFIADQLPIDPFPVGVMENPEHLMNRLGQQPLPLPFLDHDKRNRVFVSPVLLVSDAGGEGGYRAENYGILAGYTRNLSDDLWLGGHAGVQKMDVDYTGAGMESRYEQTRTYSFGAHLLYRHHRDWLFTGILSGFYGDTDFRDSAPTNLEFAQYDSHSLRCDLSLGRLFRFGSDTLLPEVGLAGVWNHRESFTTANLSNPDVDYGTMDEFEAFLRLGVKWFALFETENEWQISPSLGIGVAQTLTDGEYANTMGVGDLVTMVVDRHDTTFLTPEFGLSLARENFELTLGYSGGYSDSSENYLVWLQLGLRF